MEGLKILLLSVAAAVLYGILQDQITARFCVEYFTIGHPDFFGTDDPTTLAFGWGIVATWWVGMLLGLPLALVARCGSRPKLTARVLAKPILLVMGCVAVLALVAGIFGYVAAQLGLVWLLEPLATNVSSEKQADFLADLWAHSAAYLFGALGGAVLWVSAWKKRGAMKCKDSIAALAQRTSPGE
jgi:hypothetical protein